MAEKYNLVSFGIREYFFNLPVPPHPEKYRYIDIPASSALYLPYHYTHTQTILKMFAILFCQTCYTNLNNLNAEI